MGIFGKIGRKPKPARVPSGPPDARAYAIGDVHGRLDLLRALIDQIAADRRAHPCQREYIIFLGDLIDRGPDSRGVLDFLLQARNFLPTPVFVRVRPLTADSNAPSNV